MLPGGARERLVRGLQRTRQALKTPLRHLWGERPPREDAEFWDRLEETLLLADVGPSVCDAVLGRIRRGDRGVTARTLRERLVAELEAVLSSPGPGEPPAPAPGRMPVYLFVGSPGAGKTTTVGKLAHRFRQEGKRVLLAGSDTHRAAAGEQSTAWARRVGAELVTQREGGDAAAVVHDALRAAAARACDLVLVDTAGRLHGDRNPMEDLRKVHRVIGKVGGGGPRECFLVLDATTGQNGLQQARVFRDAVGITGVILTKLDGTARGGIALAIRQETGIPIRYLGVGEAPEDLVEFHPREFLEALMGRVSGDAGAPRETSP